MTTITPASGLFTADDANDTLPSPDAPKYIPPAQPAQARSLLDVMYEGFYMLFLLRQRRAPVSALSFRDSIKQFLADVEKGVAKLGLPASDVHLAKYAFCATVDERILRSQFSVRPDWQSKPLQLELFHEQLAGEKFFDKLEATRLEGAPRIQVLEVFHMCLLSGFEGKYAVGGKEKLGYLTARLGEEIAVHKGGRAPFAPHAIAPSNVIHTLKNEVPLWVMTSVFAFLGVVALILMNWRLGVNSEQQLIPYQDVVQPLRPNASVIITLP
jgi:type VI secretion system protein ImpK